jgi:hypothetical protein
MAEPITEVNCNEGSWSLNHGYYGLLDKSVTSWSVEYVVPNTEAAARELAGLSDKITVLVERQVGTSAHKAETTKVDIAWMGSSASLADMERLIFGRSAGDSAKPHLRLAARKEDGAWTISDYDYGAWKETL